MSLNHLKNENTAKFAEQSITRCPVGSILVSSSYKQIVIPLFQRPYCWTEDQLRGWTVSVQQGAEALGDSDDFLQELAGIEETNSDDFHSVGIGRFKIFADTLVCVDGQQRLTTTCLLVAALRDYLKKLPVEKEKQGQQQVLIDTAEHFLFNDVNQVNLLFNNSDTMKLSSLQPYVRLLPSELDRIPYFCAMLDRELPKMYPNYEEENNTIVQTKKFFSSFLNDSLSCTPNSDKLSVLSSILRSSLVWMRMMKVEVESQINLGQWFLWLQEKSLFGLASMLANDTPGVKFNAGDLVKNLLMSVFIEKPMDIQETMYTNRWIKPIQIQIGNKLDHFLDLFLVENNFKDVLLKDHRRHISAYENQILAMIKPIVNEDSDEEEEEEEASTRRTKNADKFSGICLYARFHSYYDSQLQSNDSATQDLENVHLTILNQLEKYVNVYSRN